MNEGAICPSVKIILLIAITIVVAVPALSFGATLRVPQNYLTVQSAINTSSDGDEIIVSPGTYKENLFIGGKNITLRSEDPTDTDTVKQTTIDGSYKAPTIVFSGTESENCALVGFTIKNGSSTFGGGISNLELAYYNHAVIQNNIITENSASKYGGGIYGCDGLIKYNIISKNSALNGGGGLYDCNGNIRDNRISENAVTGTVDAWGGGLLDCDGLITGNIISNNSANGSATCFGGGLASCNRLILNNIISGNSAFKYGGGLYQCYALIQTNTISHNSAESGGGLYLCDNVISNNSITANSSQKGGGLSTCGALIQNNDIRANSSGYGGGLFECSGVIWGNSITDNFASANGGGLNNCDNIIQHNLISRNTCAIVAGGLSNCDNLIKNNIISMNSANIAGGLTSIYGTIQNNLIFKNSATSGGGAIAYSYHAKIINNTIYSNFAPNGGDFISSSGSTIMNCIVWGNQNPKLQTFTTAPSYCCIENWVNGGVENISLKPALTDPDNGNFTIADNSPCIDKGNPDPQYNDGCLPPGKGTIRNDIGAYGGFSNCEWNIDVQPCIDYLLGKVSEPAQKTDLNGDGITDIADVVFFISNY